MVEDNLPKVHRPHMAAAAESTRRNPGHDRRRGLALGSNAVAALRPVSGASRERLTPAQISALDAAHVWHPYSPVGAGAFPPLVAVAARGASLTVIHRERPAEVIDAMSSWWTAIHGHGHPA